MFWNVTPCSLVHVCRYFRRKYCFSTQRSKLRQTNQEQPNTFLLGLRFDHENGNSTLLRNVCNNSYCYTRRHLWFEVLNAGNMKCPIFLNKKACSPLKVNGRFGETFRLPLQDRKIRPARNHYVDVLGNAGWLNDLIVNLTELSDNSWLRRHLPNVCYLPDF
jgi:hypothetical protein